MDSAQKTKFLRLFLSTVVIAAIGAFLFSRQGISLHDIGQAVLHFDRFCITLACAGVLFQMFVMILKFWVLLPKKTSKLFLKSARAISYGQLTNMFLPARAGDVLKVLLLSKGRPSIPPLTSTAILLSEKLIDTIAL